MGLAALAMVVLWSAGAALGVPLALYLAIVVVTVGCTFLARRVLAADGRAVVEVVATAVLVYASGWGSALGLAFAAPLVQAVGRTGASAVRPVTLASLVAIAAGQLAVARGWAPAFIAVRPSHGVAGVGALALVAVARRLHHTTREREDELARREELELRLAHRAYHDPLTGLANRAKFLDRVEHIVARSGRRSQRFAVLLLDLDGFKGVNDTLGHEAGDALLTEVAGRVAAAVRDVDTPARLGGDEFAVLLEDLRDDTDAIRVAERILSAIRRPIELDGQPTHVDSSIGIAVSTGCESATQLLRNADIAMYSAKQAGKGRFEVFEPWMHVAAVERLTLERGLAAAPGNDELVVHYQPIVALEDERIVGVEALLRWQHPERGLLGPGEFIPLAEESGLIVALGRWILTRACEDVARWHRESRGEQPLQLSVNVSAQQILSGDLVADVARALAASGLPPGSLTLEVTESTILHDVDATLHTLRELKFLGVQLAVDDFGTGASALSYLRSFPFDELKIDRAFITGLAEDSQDAALVSAIVEIGRCLNLRTVAEGIERADQASRTRTLRCEYGQGYLFARPAPAHEIERTLPPVIRLDERAALKVVTRTSDTRWVD